MALLSEGIFCDHYLEIHGLENLLKQLKHFFVLIDYENHMIVESFCLAIYRRMNTFYFLAGGYERASRIMNRDGHAIVILPSATIILKIKQETCHIKGIQKARCRSKCPRPY